MSSPKTPALSLSSASGQKMGPLQKLLLDQMDINLCPTAKLLLYQISINLCPPDKLLLDQMGHKFMSS